MYITHSKVNFWKKGDINIKRILIQLISAGQTLVYQTLA